KSGFGGWHCVCRRMAMPVLENRQNRRLRQTTLRQTTLRQTTLRQTTLRQTTLRQTTLRQTTTSTTELDMKKSIVTVPELALIAGTRVALGAGLGLLLADWLSDSQRRAVGWTLAVFGAATTIPLALEVLGHPAPEDRTQEDRKEPAMSDRGARPAE